MLFTDKNVNHFCFFAGNGLVLTDRFEKIVDPLFEVRSQIFGDLLEGRFRKIERGAFVEELPGFACGHQTHRKQDGITDFASCELVFHIPSVVERTKTLAVLVLIETTLENNFAEGRLDFLLTGTIKLVCLTVVDDGILASFVLLEIVSQPFASTLRDCYSEHLNNAFGVVGAERLWSNRSFFFCKASLIVVKTAAIIDPAFMVDSFLNET